MWRRARSQCGWSGVCEGEAAADWTEDAAEDRWHRALLSSPLWAALQLDLRMSPAAASPVRTDLALANLSRFAVLLKWHRYRLHPYWIKVRDKFIIMEKKQVCPKKSPLSWNIQEFEWPWKLAESSKWLSLGNLFTTQRFSSSLSVPPTACALSSVVMEGSALGQSHPQSLEHYKFLWMLSLPLHDSTSWRHCSLGYLRSSRNRQADMKAHSVRMSA